MGKGWAREQRRRGFWEVVGRQILKNVIKQEKLVCVLFWKTNSLGPFLVVAVTVIVMANIGCLLETGAILNT